MFKWVEGISPIKTIVKSIAVELISDAQFTLAYPSSLGSIDNVVMLKTTTSFDKDFYVKISLPVGSLTHVILQIGTEVDAGDNSIFTLGKCSAEVPYAWYKDPQDLYIGDWLPVRYWMSFSNDFVAMVVEGDASPDVHPYNKYLISPAYFGALKGYDGADNDTDYNWILTAGSHIAPIPTTTFGLRTGTGVTDLVPVGTRTGVPYQAHYPAFNTINPWMDKNFIQASQWTHKHHFSDITVVHAVDRERGKLQNILVGDKSAIFHLDELIMNKGTADEQVWKSFRINSPYSFMNNSPNVLYGIALRKS